MLVQVKFLASDSYILSKLYSLILYLIRFKNLIIWARNFEIPAPTIVKWSRFKKHGDMGAIWVETGTFLAETTTFLAKSAKHVYSIEPEISLARRAKNLFKLKNNVTIIEGTSENYFENLIGQLNGSVNFWLDGHFSGGITFKGNEDTPILSELKAIEENLSNFENVHVFIDDVRCFIEGEYQGSYPAIIEIIEWANRCKLEWQIEYDIFIATRVKLRSNPNNY